MEYVYGAIIGLVISAVWQWKLIIDLWTWKKRRRAKLESYEQQQLKALKSKQLEEVRCNAD